MSIAEFTEALASVERIVLHTGSITHDDDDDVTRREFESSFKVDSKVAVTVDSRLTRASDTKWISTITQGSGISPVGLIEKILCEVWGVVEEDEELFVVGHANGTEIYRSVTIYTPSDQEITEA